MSFRNCRVAAFFRSAKCRCCGSRGSFHPAKRPLMANAGFTKVIDLTHTFDETFPTFGGTPGIKLNKVFDFEKNGYNLYQW